MSLTLRDGIGDPIGFRHQEVRLRRNSQSRESEGVEIVVADSDSARVMARLEAMAATGWIGDEDILLLPCEEIVRIRTGEIGVAAL